MMKFYSFRLKLCFVGCLAMLVACSSTKNNEVSQAPASDDLLELLTGFGESISKRNFRKAIDYMVPEEKAMMLEMGQVPENKQKMLVALPLQRLIRHPGVRVENGHLAGIYAVLPNLKQGEATPVAENAEANRGDLSFENTEANTDTPSVSNDPGNSTSGEAMSAVNLNTQDSEADPEKTTDMNSRDPKLEETISKFFSAVNKKNWGVALALVSEDEKKVLFDDKGRLKDKAIQRLSQMDQKNYEALQLQDGKLSGLTLILPNN